MDINKIVASAKSAGLQLDPAAASFVIGYQQSFFCKPVEEKKSPPDVILKCTCGKVRRRGRYLFILHFVYSTRGLFIKSPMTQLAIVLPVHAPMQTIQTNRFECKFVEVKEK